MRLPRTAILYFVGLTSLNAIYLHAEEIRSAGHGEASVRPASKKQKDVDKANHDALDAATSAAIEDSVTNAVYKVVGRSHLNDGPRVGHEAALHRSEFEVRERTTATRATDGNAVVELEITIDREGLTSYLKNVIEVEAPDRFNHRIYVLGYTVEGQDPNRAEPRKREVVIWNSGYSHNENIGHETTDKEQAQVSARNQNASAAVGSESQKERSVAAKSVDDYLLGLRRDSAAAGASELQRNNAQASASAQSYDAAANRDFHDIGHLQVNTEMASSYIRVTDFADNTKKGAGQTDEVRAMLEGVLTRAGLDLSYYPMRLMDMCFATEDDLAGTILEAMRQDPVVKPDDYIGVAINRLTPINNAHGYTSQVSYRIMRKSDMDYLLPPKVVLGETGSQASDDAGRTTATEIAIKRAADTMPSDLKDAMTRYERRNGNR